MCNNNLTDQELKIVDRLMDLYQHSPITRCIIEKEIAKPAAERDWKACESKLWMLYGLAVCKG